MQLITGQNQPESSSCHICSFNKSSGDLLVVNLPLEMSSVDLLSCSEKKIEKSSESFLHQDQCSGFLQAGWAAAERRGGRPVVQTRVSTEVVRTPDGLWGMCFRHVQPGEGPEAAPGHDGELMSVSWI